MRCNQTSYYQYDGRGSVTANTWHNGMVTSVYRYDPYGQVELGSTKHTDFYGYNGESYNPNSGLEYLRARHYSASQGRFFQEDTYLGEIADPLTLNRYAYVKNSPMNYVDPSGHITERELQIAIRRSGLYVLSCMNYSDTEIKVHLTLEDLIGFGFHYERIDPSVDSYYENFWTLLINQYQDIFSDDKVQQEKRIRQIMTQAARATDGGDITRFISKYNSQEEYIKGEVLVRMGWSDVNPFTMYLLNSALEKYDMTSLEQRRHFIAQVTVESWRGESLKEKYSRNSPDEYFSNRDFNKYNKAVLEDGTVLKAEKGDGAKYRGAGYIQLTWKYNYNEFAKSVNDIDIVYKGVDYVADYYGWDVATWYWEKNGIKEAIDDGTADILSVSKGVNTGSMTSKITPNDLEGREKGI